MIQLVTKKNANRILDFGFLISDCAAKSFRSSGVKGLRSLALAWLALLRSVSASSLSFAGFADSGAQGLRSLALTWLALLRRGFAGQGTRILSGGLGQHEPHPA